MPSQKSHSFAHTAFAIFVALTLTLTFFFLMLPMSIAPRPRDGNILNPAFFSEHSQYPFTTDDFQRDWPNMKGRLAAPILTGKISDWVFTQYQRSPKWPRDVVTIGLGLWRYSLFAVAFAAWQSFWLGLLYALLLYYRRDALFIMLGIFAGLMINVSVVSGQWYYPWDLPMLFFCGWILLTYDNSRRLLPLIAVITLAALFKQTALFWLLLLTGSNRWPVRARLIGSACVLAFYYLGKRLLMAAYGVELPPSAVWWHSANNLVYNLHLTFGFDPIRHLNMVHVLFANGGALALLFLVPAPGRRGLLLKSIAAVQVLAVFLMGVVIEYRDWYELLPIGWILLSEHYHTSHTSLRSLPSSLP